ncbi:hypothetical protein ACFOZ0_16265 [Streptomyces yaanensis]|uniref:Uncharacterized protein n=1 Tax=Streptomyces yaanensis TaxID=1142239 RepID=A0ABV7SCW3_9ACTN|nr:hypothetical protein [Streptomyces sp. CGMCC 4.7035]WNB98384.1 hypothetical protein Q2K21_10035 [Streptomyces sp. CGMCC 4.7035]
MIVNHSDRPAQGRVPLPWSDLCGRDCRLMSSAGISANTYDRAGDELADPGLYVALDAWRCHVLALTVV